MIHSPVVPPAVGETVRCVSPGWCNPRCVRAKLPTSWFSTKPNGQGFTHFVGTADRYKRQGVATLLVQAAERWGHAHGASVAICDTFIGSPLSMPFWEQRMGYERQSVIFRKPLTD